MFTSIDKYTEHFLCGEKYNLTGLVISGSNHRKLNTVARQKIAQQTQPDENDHLYLSFASAEKPLVDTDQYMAALFAAFRLSFRDLPAIVLTTDPDSCESLVLSFQDTTQLLAYLDELSALATNSCTNQELFARIEQIPNIKSIYKERYCIQFSALMQMVSSLFDYEKAKDISNNHVNIEYFSSEEQKKEFAAIENIFNPLYEKMAKAARRKESGTITGLHNDMLLDGMALSCGIEDLSYGFRMERSLRIFKEPISKFEVSSENLQWMEEESKYFYKAYRKLAKVRGVEEFSPFCSYLHNILEIEINASVLQMMRHFLGIEMPQWYCRYCPDKKATVKTKYDVINLNKFKEGTPRRFISPGFGRVYYSFLALCAKEPFRNQMQNYFHNSLQDFINSWYKIFIQRNEESHTTSMNKQDYLDAVALMNEIFRKYSDSLSRMKRDLMV